MIKKIKHQIKQKTSTPQILFNQSNACVWNTSINYSITWEEDSTNSTMAHSKTKIHQIIPDSKIIYPTKTCRLKFTKHFCSMLRFVNLNITYSTFLEYSSLKPASLKQVVKWIDKIWQSKPIFMIFQSLLNIFTFPTFTSLYDHFAKGLSK